MTAVGKCSLPHRHNLREPIHMQLSQKLKTFCSLILHFRNLVQILDIFQKKDDPHSLFISEARVCEKRG